jgi:methionyl-tRNA synthetase
MKSKFYVTTAIDYVNSKPHVGHSYQKIIADILARFHRLKGEDVFFLTGTDEHGQKVDRSARDAGMSPKEFVDKMSVYFKQAWKRLDVLPDRFIRTTDKDHEKVTRGLTKIIWKNGDIYKGHYEGLYCTGCEAYFTERDAVDGKCPIHKTELEVLREETYFFRLSKYQNRLLEYYGKHPEFILPYKRRNEIINRVKEGLKDLSITRTSFTWGVPFPLDEKHYTYVWWEALINYISGVEWPHEKFKKFWPADVHLLGVDNGWFHCVIWPAMLMSAGIEPPKTVFIHGFLTIDGQKISKSLGNVIEPEYLVEKYGSDAIRYFLVRDITFGEDGDFSTKDLVERVNNELVSNIANFCYRTLSFIKKTGSEIKSASSDKKDTTVLEGCKKKISLIEESYESFSIDKAIKYILEIGDLGNKYFQRNEPWVLIKTDRKRCDEVLAVSANIVKDLAILLKPITPKFSASIEKQLGLHDLKWSDLEVVVSHHKIGEPEIILKKIEEVVEKRYHEEDPFSALDLKVAKILHAEDHPNADKLYVIRLDLGHEKRQIVASIKSYYTKEELVGKHLIIVSNLKPAKLRGVESNGMLLAVEKKGKLGLLTSDATPGTSVFAEGIEKKPKKELDIEEFGKLEILAKKEGVVYSGKRLKTDKDYVFVDNGMEGGVC